MPGNLEHMVAGIASAGVLYAVHKNSLNQPIDPRELVTAAIFGAVGAALPDIAERPDNPYHRGFFHSLACTGALSWLGKATIYNPACNPFGRAAVIGVVAGYGSHMILDSTTPMGVELI